MTHYAVLLFSIAWLLLISGVKADALPDTIQFAEEANWPPFTYQSDGVASYGFSYELMDEIFGRLGIDVVISLFPQKRMLEQIKTGKQDGATVISQNEERASFLEFSVPIFEKRGLIYYRQQAGETLVWNSYSDLKLLRLATVLGHNYGEEFNRARYAVPLLLVEVSSVESAFKMLDAGRVDAVLAIEWNAQSIINGMLHQEAIVAAERPYYSKFYHIGLSKKSPFVSLMPEINRVINEIKSDGSLELIRARYIRN